MGMEVERNNDYASKGVAGAGLGTGIAGLSLGVLNTVGGLALSAMENKRNSAGTDAMAAALPSMVAAASAALASGKSGCTCNEDHTVNRYELNLQQQLAAKDAQIALRDANTYGDQKMLELYKYIDGELKDIRGTLCSQAVHNQRTEDSFTLARQDIAAVKADLTAAIAMEAERRCCGDNSIVTYANATFYPKQVADVTVGTTTTAQTLYNPLPKCGCCNG